MTLSPEDKAALAAVPNNEKLAIVRAAKTIQREVIAQLAAEVAKDRAGASRQ